jgi:hypothetical protein
MAEVAVKADSFPAGPLEDIIGPKTFEMRYLGRARHLHNTLGTGLTFSWRIWTDLRAMIPAFRTAAPARSAAK